MLFLETVETIGAIWLGMSAVGFLYLAAIAKPRRSSITATGAPAADHPLDELKMFLHAMRESEQPRDAQFDRARRRR